MVRTVLNPRKPYPATNADLAGINEKPDHIAAVIFKRAARSFVREFGLELIASGFYVVFDHHFREVYWVDGKRQFNRAGVRDYLGGDGSPWIARIHVNDSRMVWSAPSTRQVQELIRMANLSLPIIENDWRGWRLELSMLPRELPAFPAWLAKLAVRNSESTDPHEPIPGGMPHPMESGMGAFPTFPFYHIRTNYVWTEAASAVQKPWFQNQKELHEQKLAIRLARQAKGGA